MTFTTIKQNIKVPISVIINNKQYYSADDLNTFDPTYFTGTNRHLRGIIIKKDIPEYNIVYAYMKDNKLIISREGYARSKLYLQDEWVFLNIPKIIQLNNNNEINIEELYNIPPAPEILILSNNEMFKDSDDNIIEIEVREKRVHNKCFFKAKDISKGFDIPRLINTIKDIRSQYIEETHYNFFTIKTINNPCKKELFLTYEGIIRLLNISISYSTKNSLLFNLEYNQYLLPSLPNLEHNQYSSHSLPNLNTKIIKNIFNKPSNEISTVYLFNIGPANHLLKTNIYSDDDILCKYGCTKNISRRTLEHKKKFKNIYQANISILLHAIIDPQYIFKAENNIKEYFKFNKLSPSYKILNIEIYYKSIQNKYIGIYSEDTNNKIIELKKEIINLNIQSKLIDNDRNNKISKIETTIVNLNNILLL